MMQTRYNGGPASEGIADLAKDAARIWGLDPDKIEVRANEGGLLIELHGLGEIDSPDLKRILRGQAEVHQVTGTSIDEFLSVVFLGGVKGHTVTLTGSGPYDFYVDVVR